MSSWPAAVRVVTAGITEMRCNARPDGRVVARHVTQSRSGDFGGSVARAAVGRHGASSQHAHARLCCGRASRGGAAVHRRAAAGGGGGSRAPTGTRFWKRTLTPTPTIPLLLSSHFGEPHASLSGALLPSRRLWRRRPPPMRVSPSVPPRPRRQRQAPTPRRCSSRP